MPASSLDFRMSLGTVYTLQVGHRFLLDKDDCIRHTLFGCKSYSGSAVDDQPWNYNLLAEAVAAWQGVRVI